jgi:hypothetical protein
MADMRRSTWSIRHQRVAAKKGTIPGLRRKCFRGSIKTQRFLRVAAKESGNNGNGREKRGEGVRRL